MCRTPRPRPTGLARYAASWVLTGALVGVLATVLLREIGPESVSLPPVRETELTRAAGHAGCDLRRFRAGESVYPPVDAPSAGGAAARPGIYERPLSPAALGAAVRRGIVVIHYRADLPMEFRDALPVVQRSVPEGTIVTPAPAAMPYQLAVTSYRRLLGCRRFSDRAYDAMRLFRGRYVGTGPSR